MLISVDDLKVYMALDLGASASAGAAVIIDGLEGDLEAHLKRPLVPTEVEDEIVKVDARGRIYLAKTPVRSVATFTVDGDLVAADRYEIVPWGMTDVWPGFMPSPMISPAPVLLVSYLGGLPGDDPLDVFTRKATGVLLRAAAREVNAVIRQDAAGLESLAVEGTSMRFHNPGGGLTDDELKGFDRWKRRISR